MATVQLSAPTHKATTCPADATANPLDPWGLMVGLPTITTPKEAYAWGHTHGREGFDLWTGDLALDLVEWARDGWHAGQQERDRRADAAPEVPDAELLEGIVEGIAEWAVLPPPEELADGIRAVIGRIAGDGRGEAFARRALEAIAQDVELFECRTFAEWDGRMNVMASSNGAA